MDTLAISQMLDAYDKCRADRDRLSEACKALLREFVPSADKFTSPAQVQAFKAAQSALARAEQAQ